MPSTRFLFGFLLGLMICGVLMWIICRYRPLHTLRDKRGVRIVIISPIGYHCGRVELLQAPNEEYKALFAHWTWGRWFGLWHVKTVAPYLPWSWQYRLIRLGRIFRKGKK